MFKRDCLLQADGWALEARTGLRSEVCVCVTCLADLMSNHLAEVGEALKPGICGILPQSAISCMLDQASDLRASVHDGSAGLLVKKLNFGGGRDGRA